MLFFLLSDYRNIEYRAGEFLQLSDYQISDQGHNISDYRISDSNRLRKNYYLQQSLRIRRRKKAKSSKREGGRYRTHKKAIGSPALFYSKLKLEVFIKLSTGHGTVHLSCALVSGQMYSTSTFY
jgi:hypothetical protein